MSFFDKSTDKIKDVTYVNSREQFLQRGSNNHRCWWSVNGDYLW